MKGSSLLPLLFLVAASCGEKASPPVGEATPPPANQSTRPVTVWDSLLVDVAEAIASGDATAMRQLREQLMSYPEEPGTGDPDSGHDAFPGPSRAVRLYLLGELAASLGDSLGIQAAMDSLMSPQLIGGALPRKPGSYASTLQALILEFGGQHDRAVARLDSVVAGIDPSHYPILWVGATLERPRLIGWLRSRGEAGKADSLRSTVTLYGADSLVRWPR